MDGGVDALFWVGGLWGGRGERSGSNDLLWVLYGWVGGWVGRKRTWKEMRAGEVWLVARRRVTSSTPSCWVSRPRKVCSEVSYWRGGWVDGWVG